MALVNLRADEGLGGPKARGLEGLWLQDLQDQQVLAIISDHRVTRYHVNTGSQL